MANSQAPAALQPFRVLDLSRVRAGPTCVRMLADFGADVIRIEPPQGIDPNEARFAADRLGGDFQNLNRNKRSLTLNLKKEKGRKILLEMIRDADVVVENWRPNVKARLGLDYESLQKINPGIILASISGFGQDGPYVERPGFDQIIQGMGGLMSVTGLPGQGPMRAGLAVADSSAGLYAAFGIVSALLERTRSGKGQWVQVSLLHAQIAMMDFQMARFLNDGDIPVQAGNDHPTSCPMGVFETSDGAMNLGAAGEGNWLRLCKALGVEQWLDMPEFRTEKDRVASRSKVNALLNQVFSENTTDHWVRLLNHVGVPAGPIYSVPQVFEDVQVQHLDVVAERPTSDNIPKKFIRQPVRLNRTPAKVKHAAPGWGEHTREILLAEGYSEAEIGDLHAEGIV